MSICEADPVSTLSRSNDLTAAVLCSLHLIFKLLKLQGGRCPSTSGMLSRPVKLTQVGLGSCWFIWSCEASAQSGCSERAGCALGMCTWPRNQINRILWQARDKVKYTFTEASRKCSKSRKSQGLHSINNSFVMFSSSEFGEKFSVSLLPTRWARSPVQRLS